MTNLITFNCKILIHTHKCINIKLIHAKNTQYSLLSIFKKYQIPINYQCQSGYCGSCRIILISGSIKYYCTPLSYIHTNEILLCCCYPMTNIVLKL